MLGRPELRGAIPFAGLEALRVPVKRTALQQAALGLAAIGLLVTTVLVARGLQTPVERAVPQGRSGVIVVDVSRSVSPSRILEVRDLLSRFSSSGQRAGLVFFSDTAYELLPLGSPGAELRPFVQLFTPYRIRPHARKLRLPQTPWDESFRAGTLISTGLRTAREALQRQGIRKGTILLVSDLNTVSDDLPRVAETINAMRSARIELRIAALDPAPANRILWERLAGKAAFVPLGSLGGGAGGGLESALRASVPASLVIAEIALLALLALNELWCGRLLVPRTRPRGLV